MKRLFLSIVLGGAMAACFSGCESSGGKDHAFTEWGSTDTGAPNPLLIVGSGYTRADLTNYTPGSAAAVAPVRVKPGKPGLGNSPFAEYDAVLIEKIRNRWAEVLTEARGSLAGPQGEVVVQFQLHHNGSVTGIKVVHNTTDARFAHACERAVAESQPFAKWPREMRSMIGADIRDVRFTFNREP